MRISKKIVVAGGGPAGSLAAIAAAKLGTDVTVIERYNCLGGTMTSGLLAFLGPFDNAQRGQPDWDRFRLDRDNKPYPPELTIGERIIKGLPEEILNELLSRNAAEVPRFGYMPINPETAKQILEEKLLAAGGSILYNTLIVEADYLEDGRIELTLANKAGLKKLIVHRVIDCTGDGDVAAFLGAEFKHGRPEDGAAQGVTLVFWLGGVTIDPLNLLPDAGSRFREDADKAYSQGEFSINPHGIGCQNYIPGMPGTVMVNLQHCFGIDATDPDAATRAVIKGRHHIREHVRFLKNYVPGFEDCFLLATAPMLGVRETRRIMGDYILTRKDVLGCAKFPDSVCRFNYELDIHLPGLIEDTSPPPGDWYGIPYRCLLPKALDNLLMAGRCISTDHYALSSMRLMSCCGSGAGSRHRRRLVAST